jgi:protocatechuate 3,4-dioxygenase beta subunit
MPARTGMLAGVVRSTSGRPFAGACVTAVGPAGSSRAETQADGRYVLSGLRPGRYVLRLLPCAPASTITSEAGAVSLWPGLPATVALRAGEVATLPSAMIAQHGRFRLTLGSTSAGAGSKTGSISGRVMSGGRPLKGICAEAWPVKGGLVGRATTSKDGRYRIGQLPPGRYQVEFADQACPGGVNWLAQWYPRINTPFGPAGTQLHVRAGKNIGRIDGALKAGGELSGIVRSKSGKRLRGICVLPTAILPANGANGAIYDELTTNTDGYFSWHALFPGQYRLLFTIGCGSHGNFALQWWKGTTSASRSTTIHITGHDLVRNIDPALGPGAAINGTVRGTSAAGPPLPGICVYDSYGYANSVTKSDGRYELDGLAGGRYQIVFDPTCGSGYPPAINYVERTQSVTVTAGGSVRGFNAYLERGATLSGTVTDAGGRQLVNVCVQVGDPDGDFAVTDGHGAYSVTGIQPGSYTVAFSGGCGNSGSLAPQSYPDQPDPFTAALVRFRSGKTTANINAVMGPGGTIAGVVTDTSGHRLRNICVDAQTEADLASMGYTVEASTSRGRYALRNLAPGPYLVSFNCNGGNRYTSPWFNGHAGSSPADLLSVQPGVVTTASATLGLAGSIAGTITDKWGFGICVNVDSANNQTPVSLPGSGGFTAHGGSYFIGGLTPGRYLVQFSQCNGKPRYGSQWYRDKGTAAAATPVTVRAGHTTARINAAMVVGGSISGLVTNRVGQPLRGECVDALDTRAQSAAFAQTNRAGRYTFTGLATGSYTLHFFSLATGDYTLFGPCQPIGPTPTGRGRPGLVTVIAPTAVTAVNFRLEPGGSVSGRVTAAAPASTPLGGLCVLLRPLNHGDGSAIAFTSTNGRYLAPDLAPGKYLAYFNDPSCLITAGPAPQWYDSQPVEATATDFTVTAGHTTTDINAALRPYGGITGSVTNRAHAGVRGECVTAVPVAQGVDPFDGVSQAAEIAVTSRTGRYALADVAPGRYKIEFTTGCGDKGYATQWWDDAGSPSSAEVITVRFATSAGISAVLRHHRHRPKSTPFSKR